MNKEFLKLRQQRLAANEKLGDLFVKVGTREMTAEETLQKEALERELSLLDEKMKLYTRDQEMANASKAASNVEKNRIFREILKEAKDTGQKRELLLAPAADSGVSSPAGYISNSGAIELSIHDLIPTLH